MNPAVVFQDRLNAGIICMTVHTYVVLARQVVVNQLMTLASWRTIFVIVAVSAQSRDRKLGVGASPASGSFSATDSPCLHVNAI